MLPVPIIANFFTHTVIQCLLRLWTYRRRRQCVDVEIIQNNCIQQLNNSIILSQNCKHRSIWMKVRSDHFWTTTVLQHFEDEDFIENFRLTRELFFDLVEQLRPDLEPQPTVLQSREPISAAKQVAIAFNLESSIWESYIKQKIRVLSLAFDTLINRLSDHF